MDSWALAALYSLHLIATVVWVGGLVIQAVIVWPAARAAFGPGLVLSDLQARWRRIFNPLAWISLAVLVGTGLFQMSADPNYHGTLVIDNAWSAAMLVKHLAAAGMAVIGAISQWLIQPQIARTQLQLRRGRPALDPPPADAPSALEQRELQLVYLNLACAAVVLVCTAIATAQ